MQNKYDDVLKSGLSELKRTEFSCVPVENEIEHVFSENYDEKKQRSFKQLLHSRNEHKYVAVKRLAILIAVLVILFSSLMSVSATRQKLLDFFYDVYHAFIQIEIKPVTNKGALEKEYTISVIPNNYSLSHTSNNNLMKSTFFVNENEQVIKFTQTVTSALERFNSEQGELSEVVINDMPCLVCENDSNYFCYWDFDGYRFELIYPMELGEKYMAEVVGKLVEVEK